MRRKIVVELEFDRVVDDTGYVYYDLVGLKRLESTVPDHKILSIQESWTQSDRFYEEVVNGIIDVIDGHDIELGR